jgi:hypothetical protein
MNQIHMENGALSSGKWFFDRNRYKIKLLLKKFFYSHIFTYQIIIKLYLFIFFYRFIKQDRN